MDEKVYVPPGSGPDWWVRLSAKQKVAATEPFFNAHKSNTSIAGSLGITPGSVANLRNRRNRRLNPERFMPGGAVRRPSAPGASTPGTGGSRRNAFIPKPPAAELTDEIKRVVVEPIQFDYDKPEVLAPHLFQEVPLHQPMRRPTMATSLREIEMLDLRSQRHVRQTAAEFISWRQRYNSA